jgi:hypothetical protein
MILSSESARSAGDIYREVNALYGLIAFAQDRCYPDAITRRLRALAADYRAELDRHSAAGGTRAVA